MKDNGKRMRRRATDWENIFAKDTSKKDYHLKYKRNSNSTKGNSLIKNEPTVLADTSPRKIYRWKVSI